ncbi:hypothetical protein [Nocardia sp. NPDC059195]
MIENDTDEYVEIHGSSDCRGEWIGIIAPGDHVVVEDGASVEIP